MLALIKPKIFINFISIIDQSFFFTIALNKHYITDPCVYDNSIDNLSSVIPIQSFTNDTNITTNLRSILNLEIYENVQLYKSCANTKHGRPQIHISDLLSEIQCANNANNNDVTCDINIYYHIYQINYNPIYISTYKI